MSIILNRLSLCNARCRCEAERLQLAERSFAKREAYHMQRAPVDSDVLFYEVSHPFPSFLFQGSIIRQDAVTIDSLCIQTNSTLFSSILKTLFLQPHNSSKYRFCARRSETGAMLLSNTRITAKPIFVDPQTKIDAPRLSTICRMLLEWSSTES